MKWPLKLEPLLLDSDPRQTILVTSRKLTGIRVNEGLFEVSGKVADLKIATVSQVARCGK